MAEPLEISADHARRFLVRRQLLDPPRSLPARAASVLRAIDQLGFLQFDPLEVPGARNHDLVLHARIAGYRREWCDQWLYGKPRDRRLIELYNKSLNILPISELPHYRITWTKLESEYSGSILREQAAVAEAILERIQADGPMSTAAFREHSHAIDWWWAPTPAARAVMEALFVTGRLGIARREGSRRYYDLIERLVPADLLTRHESEEDAMRHRLLSRYRGVGLAAAVGGPAELMLGTGTTAERRRRTDALVSDGVLIPVQVEGSKATRYVLAEEEPILDATSDPASRPSPAVTFLAPLDPMIWDRRLLRDLFGFDYIWEVYIPAAKRRWGYYVLPILFGDRLVGRIEPRLDKASPDLKILGIWFEKDFSPMEAPGFIAALRDALEAYRSFVGARRIVWPRTRPGRDIAKAMQAAQ
jgi:uncharacterized protein YcaQ